MINAFYNGVFCDFRDVEIPLSDRSIFFGDAVYEVVLGRGGKLYDFEAHKARLTKSCEAVKLDIPDNLDNLIKPLVKLNEFECFSLYIQVARRCEKREHAPKVKLPPSLLMFIEKAQPEDYTKAVALITIEDKRGRMCNVKSVNLLPNVIAAIEASENGADEAILIRENIVTEGSKSNLMILTDGILKTHPANHHILPGITRAKALDLAQKIGIRVIEDQFSSADMMNADEVIISSSTKLLRRAIKINGISVGGRDYARACALQNALYRDFISKTN